MSLPSPALPAPISDPLLDLTASPPCWGACPTALPAVVLPWSPGRPPPVPLLVGRVCSCCFRTCCPHSGKGRVWSDHCLFCLLPHQLCLQQGFLQISTPSPPDLMPFSPTSSPLLPCVAPPHPSRVYTVLFVCPDGGPEVCTRLLLLLPDRASHWGRACFQGSLPSHQPSFPVNPARSTRLTIPSPSAWYGADFP